VIDRFKRLAAATVAVFAIAVGSAVVANAASDSNSTTTPSGEVQTVAPGTTDVAPVQQSRADPDTGRPPCHHGDRGSGSNDSGSSGSSSGSSSSSGQI
jgi:hypothetical protein